MDKSIFTDKTFLQILEEYMNLKRADYSEYYEYREVKRELFSILEFEYQFNPLRDWYDFTASLDAKSQMLVGFWQQLKNDDEKTNLYLTYSGRGMFGQTTIAVSSDYLPQSSHIGTEYNHDSLGMGYVIY